MGVLQTTFFFPNFYVRWILMATGSFIPQATVPYNEMMQLLERARVVAHSQGLLTKVIPYAFQLAIYDTVYLYSTIINHNQFGI